MCVLLPFKTLRSFIFTGVSKPMITEFVESLGHLRALWGKEVRKIVVSGDANITLQNGVEGRTGDLLMYVASSVAGAQQSVNCVKGQEVVMLLDKFYLTCSQTFNACSALGKPGVTCYTRFCLGQSFRFYHREYLRLIIVFVLSSFPTM